MNKIILFSILAVILLSVSFTSISASPETEQKLTEKIKTLEKKIKNLLVEITKLKTENNKLKAENDKLKAENKLKTENTKLKTKPNTALGPEDCTSDQVWQNNACVVGIKPLKNDLKLQTDKTLYRQGDVVVISGMIHNIENLSTGDVAVIVRAPDNNIVTTAMSHPNADGSFQTSLKADGPQFKSSGKYTILANFSGLKSEISFKFTGGSGDIISGGDSQPTTCPSGQNLINGKCVVKPTPEPEPTP